MFKEDVQKKSAVVVFLNKMDILAEILPCVSRKIRFKSENYFFFYF
jgi:hypothetical protein